MPRLSIELRPIGRLAQLFLLALAFAPLAPAQAAADGLCGMVRQAVDDSPNDFVKVKGPWMDAFGAWDSAVTPADDNDEHCMVKAKAADLPLAFHCKAYGRAWPQLSQDLAGCLADWTRTDSAGDQMTIFTRSGRRTAVMIAPASSAGDSQLWVFEDADAK